MKKYSVFIIFPVLFVAVASTNIQITTMQGTVNSVIGLPEPFEKIGDNYYIIETTVKRNWHGAANFCRTQGAFLTSIDSEDEWKALTLYLESQGYKNHYFWIGTNDFDETSKFVWINSGQPMLFTKWSENQPDNWEGVERCVHLWYKANEIQMNDKQCYMQAFYICKADNPKTVTITAW